MKLLAVILVFMIAAQPVQAGVCKMQSSGEGMSHIGMAAHDAEQDRAHGDDHQAGGTADHDCCNPVQGGDSDSHSDCANGVFCGSCVAALSALTSFQEAPGFLNADHRPVTDEGQLTTRHTSPPLRPPIQNS